MRDIAVKFNNKTLNKVQENALLNIIRDSYRKLDSIKSEIEFKSKRIAELTIEIERLNEQRVEESMRIVELQR